VCMPQRLAWDDQLARAEALSIKHEAFRIACSRNELRTELLDLLNVLTVPGATAFSQGSPGAARAAGCILQMMGVRLARA
jgi:hypothetical protein